MVRRLFLDSVRALSVPLALSLFRTIFSLVVRVIAFVHRHRGNTDLRDSGECNR